MGYLLNGSLEGDAGWRRAEYDTVHCAHCQHIIKICLKGGVKKYDTPFRCQRCNSPICRFCGTQRAGQCSPIAAQIDRALTLQTSLEQFEFHYRSTSRT